MGPDKTIRQRAIVGRRIAFADGEQITKYTLPFVDAEWTVPFTVLDLFGGPPCVLEGSLHIDGSRLRSPVQMEDLRSIESLPLERFETLVHFDPWWAFRGVSGVPRAAIDAIFATNIARPFRRDGRTWKLEDLEFSGDLRSLRHAIAKDDGFHRFALGRADLDLLALKPGPQVGPHRDVAPTAKSL